MNMQTAVIYRLNDLIKEKDLTVNDAAVRSGVPPSTLKNILYGQSKNAGVVTIKKICDWIGDFNTRIFWRSHLCRSGTRVIGILDNLRIQILQDGFFLRRG